MASAALGSVGAALALAASCHAAVVGPAPHLAGQPSKFGVNIVKDASYEPHMCESVPPVRRHHRMWWRTERRVASSTPCLQVALAACTHAGHLLRRPDLIFSQYVLRDRAYSFGVCVHSHCGRRGVASACTTFCKHSRDKQHRRAHETMTSICSGAICSQANSRLPCKCIQKAVGSPKVRFVTRAAIPLRCFEGHMPLAE